MYLSCLGMSLKILLQHKLVACIYNHLQITHSTFSLFWSQWLLKCCFSGPNKWCVARCDSTAQHCNPHVAYWTRVVAFITLGTYGLSVLLCHWSNSWEVADSTVTRKWKWPFVNCCRCKSLMCITGSEDTEGHRGVAVYSFLTLALDVGGG